jgi:O-antigen ligase
MTESLEKRPTSPTTSATLTMQHLRPTWVTSTLFFLLFSGPPSFRLRDPEASLEGIIDPTVILQVSVWIIAGIWTLYQFRKGLRDHAPVEMGLPDKLGIVLIFLLGLSIFVSEAPPLTAFKVGQMFVSLLFTFIFVKRYGIAKCLDYIFICSTVLCIAIAVCAFAVPDLVLFSTSDGMRLRGDPIAVAGIVVTYSMILLLIKSREIPKVVFWFLLALLSVLLAASLTRQAWFLVLAFSVFYFAKRSKGPFVRKLWFLFLAILPFIFLFVILPALEQYRSEDSVGTLTGRTDLWVYLVGVTIVRSPLIGLGYFSASRILGPDFNPGMGTAHSMFVEVLLGGGLLSLIPLVALCLLLSFGAFQLLSKGRTQIEFTCGVMFIVTLALGAMGGDIAFGQVGITFWSLAAAIPALQLRHSVLRRPVSSPTHLEPRRVTRTGVLPTDSREVET